ncbi:MAG TPA: hypothetical protein VEQ10_10400 [Vicinamibacteria bacterium]|nr:hypothetical protein [Vicinamibacteria bacterium]
MTEQRDAQRGYETLDAQAGATYRAGLYILGAMFLAALIAVPVFWVLARQETRSQPPVRTVVHRQAAADAPAGGFPRLVSSEPAVLAAFRRHEDELLNGYAWVEKDRGIARMPVSEAMRIVGQRGTLPSFKAASPSPGTTVVPGEAR